MPRKPIPGRLLSAEKRVLARSTTIYGAPLDPINSEAPSSLSPEARAEFDKLIQIDQRGILLNIDLPVVTLYCETSAQLEYECALMKTKAGRTRAKILLFHRLTQLKIELLSQLRMTPLSRAAYEVRAKTAKQGTLQDEDDYIRRNF